jgi:hypothetical protein
MLFDHVRKKWLSARPEEIVRQLLIHFLIEEKHTSKNHLSIERQISVNKMMRRYDLVIYNQKMSPVMLAECKAPDIAIEQKVFDQIAVYNLEFRVPYLLVTNGWATFCTKMNYDERAYEFLDKFPSLS